MKKQIITAILLLTLTAGGCSDRVDVSSSGLSPAVTTTATDLTTAETTSAQTTAAATTQFIASDIKLYAELALDTGEWPMMAEITDEVALSEDFGIEADNPIFDDFCVYKCPMSSAINEIIIIDPADGQASEVMNFLTERKNKLINKFAFYPSDKEMAEASVVSEAGSICYLICSQNSVEVDNMLKVLVLG